MNKHSILVTLFLISSTVFSQTPVTTPTVPVTPTKPVLELTKSEQLAFKYLQQESNQLQSDIIGFQQDVGVQHPGYFYNFQTNTLELIKKEQPAAPAKSTPKEDKK